MLAIRNLFVFCFLALSLTKAACELYPARFEGLYEEFKGPRLDLIARFLPDDPVIFEAGGHYGHDTINFAAKWPNSKIVTFEANPEAFKKFSETTKGLPNVQGYNLAVNNYNGKAVLHVCYGTSGDNPVFEGASSLLEASEWMKQHYRGPKVIVPCVILDDWCRDNRIERFDFLWLDLEGLELQVLQSSPRVLEQVKVIYTETNFQEFRKGMTQFKALRQFLENSGFKLLAHWYAENFQGDAIFLKNDVYDEAVAQYFQFGSP